MKSRLAMAIPAAILLFRAVAPAVSLAQNGSTLSGSVVVRGTDKPVRGALVSVRVAADGNLARQVVSDEEGRFQADVPEGKYTVAVSKIGFLTTEFGATQFGHLGSIVIVGRASARIVVPLTPASVISGVVRNEQGDPLAGVSVAAISQSLSSMTQPVLTNRDGQYRLFGLAQDTYWVIAEPGPNYQQVSVTRPTDGRALMLTPAFHPGNRSQDTALPVTLDAGTERPGIDVSLRYVPSYAVKGVVVEVTGQPVLGAMIRLIPAAVTSRFANIIAISTSIPSGSDGGFVAANVAGGEYYMVASLGASGGHPKNWSIERVAIDADTDVRLTLRPTVTLVGQVLGIPPSDLPRFSIELFDESVWPGRPGLKFTSALKDDGSFSISGLVPGRYRFRIDRPYAWSVVSTTVDGVRSAGPFVEVSDASPTARLRFDVAEATASLVVSSDDSLSANSGSVLFSADDVYWFVGSDRIRVARVADDNRFSFQGVPPGDYFVAVLRDAVSQDAMNKEFLSVVRSSSVRVSLRANETTTQSVKIR